MKLRRRQIVVTCVLTGLVCAVGLSYRSYASQVNTTAHRLAGLSLCRNLSGEITRLQQRRSVIRSEKLEETVLAQRVEAALKVAEVDLRQLVRVAPQPPRPIENTQYRALSSRITIRRITLPQLVHTLHVLVTRDPDLRIDRIQLSAPREETNDNVWRVEVEVKYLLYTPWDGASALSGETP